MEMKMSLDLLAKFAKTQEKFILKYDTGRQYVAQFNSFGVLLLWQDKHLVKMGMVILDHISEVMPINKKARSYALTLSEVEAMYNLMNKHYWKIVLVNFLKRIILKLEGEPTRVI